MRRVSWPKRVLRLATTTFRRFRRIYEREAAGLFPDAVARLKKSIHDAAGQTLQSPQDGPIREPDLNDRASSETDWGIELRTRDRQRKLILKIDAALRGSIRASMAGARSPATDRAEAIDRASRRDDDKESRKPTSAARRSRATIEPCANRLFRSAGYCGMRSIPAAKRT